jgi:hypothetical protein
MWDGLFYRRECCILLGFTIILIGMWMVDGIDLGGGLLRFQVLLLLR